MISIRLARAVFAAFFVAALCGCDPTGSGQPDEEKEPHYLRGRERVNAMDYGGALESFEKALEVNPHSGAAHFELAWLCANKQSDPAAAIYHYERYLKLRPGAENADTIRQHILGLKQDLAKAVLPLPSAPAVQQQLDKLMETNRLLTDEVIKLRANFTNRETASPPKVLVASPDPARQPAPSSASPSQQQIQTNRQPAVRPATKTYRVQAGDTPSSISRKHNVKLDALMSANPGLDPRRMQVGQVLNIPAPLRD